MMKGDPESTWCPTYVLHHSSLTQRVTFGLFWKCNHTLERIENGEDVVGGKPQGTMGKERNAPRDAQSAAQSKDTPDACPATALLDIHCSRCFGHAEPG